MSVDFRQAACLTIAQRFSALAGSGRSPRCGDMSAVGAQADMAREVVNVRLNHASLNGGDCSSSGSLAMLAAMRPGQT